MSYIDTYELDYLRGLAKTQEKVDLQSEQLFCECHCVSIKEIHSFCLDKAPLKLTDQLKFIQEELRVGTACGSCIKDPRQIEKIIESRK